MKRLHILPLFIIWVGVVFAMGMITEKAFGFNPVSDVLQNTTFPIGTQASAGTAINLKNGNTATTMLAPVADYRGLLLLSVGALRDNQSGANFQDTVKIGFELNWLFSKFTNPLPATGAFLKNINLGPGYGVSAVTNPGVGWPFFDINYTFK